MTPLKYVGKHPTNQSIRIRWFRYLSFPIREETITNVFHSGGLWETFKAIEYYQLQKIGS